MYKRLALILVGISLYASSARAQIPVTDAGNALLNSVTSLQSTITAGQAIIQTGYQFLELLPLDEISLGASFLGSLETVGGIIGELEGLIADAQSADAQVRVLFGLENRPLTPIALQQRVNVVNTLIFESRVYATRVQSLIRTFNSAVNHIMGLVSKIQALTGNQAANQVIIQQLGVANQTLITSGAGQIAKQRTDTLEEMKRQMVIETLTYLEAQRWRDWPSYGGR